MINHLPRLLDRLLAASALLAVTAAVPSWAASVGPIPYSAMGKPGGPATLDTTGHRVIQGTVREYGAVCDGVADDSTALAAGATALRGTGLTLEIPGDCKLRMGGAAQTWLSGMQLVGPGGRETGVGGYGLRGGTIIVDDTTKAPFVVSDDWGMRGLIFYWKGQTEAAAANNGSLPVQFPALLLPHTTVAGATSTFDSVRNFWFVDNQVENAFDIADFHLATSVGSFHWSRNQEYALHYHLHLAEMGSESFVDDNQFSPAPFIYATPAPPGGTLMTYATANAEILHVDGGNAVEGLRMSGNYAFAMRYGLHMSGGTLNLATLTGNSFDQVSTPIQVDNGGIIGATTVSGGTWLCESLNNSSVTAPCISVVGAGNSLSLSNVAIGVAVGSGVVFHDTGVSSLQISGGQMLNLGEVGGGATFPGIDFTAPLGVLTVTGLPITSTSAYNSASAFGIVIGGAKSSNISAVTLGGWGVPLVYNATAGAHAVSGSVSYGSAGTVALAGPGAIRAAQSGNAWDVGLSNTVVQVPAGQNGGISCNGPDAAVDCRVTVQGSGRLVVQSSVGVMMIAQANGTAAQTAFPQMYSAPAGGTVGYSASSGNVQISAVPGNFVLIPSNNLPLCTTGPAGYLCTTGSAVGSAVQTK